MNLMLNYEKNKNKYNFERMNLMRSKSEQFLNNNSSGNTDLSPDKKQQINSSKSDSGKGTADKQNK